MKRRGFIRAVLAAPIAARVVLQNALTATVYGLPTQPVIRGWVGSTSLDTRGDVRRVFARGLPW